jgi:hypothetical protein
MIYIATERLLLLLPLLLLLCSTAVAAAVSHSAKILSYNNNGSCRVTRARTPVLVSPGEQLPSSLLAVGCIVQLCT